jgi:hypothetical protein
MTAPGVIPGKAIRLLDQGDSQVGRVFRDC